MTPGSDPALAGRAQEIVGPPHLLTAAASLAPYAIDGVRPLAVARPETPEETAALLAAAGETGAAVFPWGAGAHQHLGATPPRVDLVVDTSRQVGITDYTPADYVVAVRAGTPLRDLQTALAANRQWVPLDPPGAAAATVGGLVAANRNGPRRLLWGSIRDMVIGLRVALGARAAAILRQFLIEAVVPSTGGGALGVALGGVGAMAIALFGHWPATVPMSAVALALLFSAAVGVFFGYWPARKAAALDPIRALRFE